ncbi:hypothetical protein ACFL54_08525 [Planctomycetota bacterium]
MGLPIPPDEGFQKSDNFQGDLSGFTSKEQKAIRNKIVKFEDWLRNSQDGGKQPPFAFEHRLDNTVGRIKISRAIRVIINLENQPFWDRAFYHNEYDKYLAKGKR